MLQAAPVHQAHQAQSLSHRAPIRHAVLQHHLAEGNDNFPLRGEFHCIGKKIDNHLTDAQLIRLCKVLHSGTVRLQLIFCQRQHTDNPVHRRTNFMRHTRKEGCFGAASSCIRQDTLFFWNLFKVIINLFNFIKSVAEFHSFVIMEDRQNSGGEPVNYQECIHYLEEDVGFSSIPGLERIQYLCDLLGNPEQRLPVIHVAGTNGKGSAVAMLSSILKEAGYRVGAYTSPHLERYNERYLLNGAEISDDDFAKEITLMRQLCEKLAADLMPRMSFPTLCFRSSCPSALTIRIFWGIRLKKLLWKNPALLRKIVLWCCIPKRN